MTTKRKAPGRNGPAPEGSRPEPPPRPPCTCDCRERLEKLQEAVRKQCADMAKRRDAVRIGLSYSALHFECCMMRDLMDHHGIRP